MPAMVARSTTKTSQPACAEEILNDPLKKAKWLEDVLCRCLDMDEDDARFITGVVIDHFGDKRELLDDELDSDVRSIFYTLEAKRILTFRRIEYEGEEGQTLRGFFWRFHVDRIEEDLQQAAEMEEEDLGVYESLPSDCWKRSSPA